MTVVSTKEFNTHQEKYLDMALNERVAIKRGKNIIHLIYDSSSEYQFPEQPILEPDDDFRRAIPMTEVRDRVLEYIRKKHAN